MKIILLASLSLASFIVPAAHAFEKNEESVIQACIAVASRTARDDQTLGELRQQCQQLKYSIIGRRVMLENSALSNPFAILPYKPNYILPVTYFDANEDPYINRLQGYHLDNVETKFQFSVKYVVAEDVLFDALDLQIAFTATSWWQSYNSNISAPFRETNYEPEFIFNYKKPWSLAGLTVANCSLSFSHQSNGQAGELSRSWNRIIGSLAFGFDDSIWNIRAWWRLPEDEKITPGDPAGDDNPNIEKFMGYGEVGALWKLPRANNLDILLRNNLRSDNKGAIQIGWSFPFSKHLRWYLEYFNGYGESLIYYDQHITRFGFGIKLTDWL